MESVSWTKKEPKYDKREVLFEADIDQEENKLLNIYTDIKDQIWNGFGGAATESAAYVYSKLSEEKKKLFLEKYFGKDGLNYKTIRVPIDSCDFSLEQFEAGKEGSCDEFSMERAGKYILPLLEDIKSYTNNEISLFLSPWSPPVAFKDVDTRHAGGRLLPKYYDAYAAYLCRYIEEYKNRGYKVEMLSIQNEAKAVQTWDSCVYTAEEEKEFLVHHLKPAMVKRGHGDILVFVWDHNKERIFDRARITLSGEGGECADGAAFHWYSGDHFEMLDLFRKQFPNKKLILSESCLEYSILDVSNPFLNAAKIAHEIIGDMKHGMEMFFDWNMLLDEKGGPNYVGNFCHAPMMYDEKKEQLELTSLYDCFYQFSNYLEIGDVRVETSSYTKDIEAVAFQGVDDTLKVIALNHSSEDKEFILRNVAKDEIAKCILPKQSLTTFIG